MEPSFDQPEQPFPRRRAKNQFSDSQLQRWHMCDQMGAKPNRYGNGTLKISVPNGDETYYARLKSRRGGVTATDVIIRPGRTAKLDVPVCDGRTTYDLHYGAGTKWYGSKYLFGPRGAYSEADKVFTFEDGTVWRVSLSLRPAGNLSTSGMDYREFIE